MNTRDSLAVVDDRYFYNCGKRWPHGDIDCLATLAEMSEASGLKHIWIVPGTQVSRLAKDEPFELANEITDWNVTGIGKDAFNYLSVRRNSQRYEDHMEIGIPEWSSWPWKEGGDRPGTLLATLAYLENELGFPVAWTPAWNSLEFIKRENASNWSWLTPMTLDLESKGFSYADDIAKELYWPEKGVQIAPPPGATHYIWIDGNSAYAAVMPGLNIGEGNPEWTDIPNGVYNGKIPGIWKIHFGVTPSRCLWDGKRLPSWSDGKNKRTWATTDLIEQMRRSHAIVFVEAGWHWGKPDDKKPRYHQWLRTTAEKLWRKRVDWRKMDGQSAAHHLVNESLRVMIKAIHGKLARQDNIPQLRRRDVWAGTVSRSVAGVGYRIEAIYKEYGLLPVGIKADELKYAVSDPHVFDKMLDRDKFGGFKLVKIEEIS